MANDFDPYYEWLGIPPCGQPPNHYRLLGIGLFEENAEVIANAADRQMGHLRGFAAGKRSQWSQKLLNEVAAARVCLLNVEKKAAYDGQLRDQLAAAGASTPRELAIAAKADLPAAQSDSGVVIHSEDVAHRAPRHTTPLPIPIAVGGPALVLLGAMVWWLAGAGGSQPGIADGPPTASRDSQPPPPPPPAPAERDVPSDRLEEPPAKGHDGPAEDGADSVEPPGDSEPSGPDPPFPPAAYDTDLRAADADEPFRLSPWPANPDEDEPSEPAASREPLAMEPPPVSEPVRQPVPDRARQDEVRRMLDETYDTLAARAPGERLQLADQLAVLAGSAEDPAERFVLMRRAAELASEGNRPARMLHLVGRIADEFEIDRLAAQVHMLDGFSKRASSEEQIGALVNSAAEVIDAAMAAGRFDLADSLSAGVYRVTLATAGRPFRVDALQRRREVQEQRDRWDEFQAALAALESNPADEAANMVAGRWYALVQGDWDRAMQYFAEGSPPELRALASREMAGPPEDVEAGVELADAWWDLAENSDSQSKPYWLARAAYWYEEALPELSSPLVRAKVSKRLETLRESEQPGPRPPGAAPPPAVAPFDARQATQHQQAWSRYLKTPVVQTNSAGMRIVLIPPGEFMMGSAEEQIAQLADTRWQRAVGSDSHRLRMEAPQRLVRITRPFYMGVHPVTQAEYERVMGTNPTRLRAEPNRPVDSVSWAEAVEFCRRLSALPAEQAAGRGYRLPTEAEWEYACRAGTTTWFSFGDDPALLSQHGWWSGNSQRRLQLVARLKPNPWGLHDMHGNIAQWCSDRFAGGYQTSPVDDPRGPSTGTSRIVRGGSYADNPRECRSAARAWESPYGRSTRIGFRVVMVAASELPAREPVELEPPPREEQRPAPRDVERPDGREERRPDRRERWRPGRRPGG